MYPTELGTPKSEYFLHEEVPLALELFQGELFLVLPGYLIGEANPFIGVWELAKPQ